MGNEIGIIVLVILFIVIALPIIPIEHCAATLFGLKIVCVTDHVSILQIIFGR